MLVFGRCFSVVEGPAAALHTEINQDPTRSRSVAGMIRLSARIAVSVRSDRVAANPQAGPTV
jgi:hypothetical protein